MTYYNFHFFLGMVCLMLTLVSEARSQTMCPPLSAAEALRVRTFLQSRDSRIAEVHPESVSVTTGACYRAIGIKRVDGSADTAFLSPDHRYLSMQVLDTRPDLTAKESIRRTAITAMLDSASNGPEEGSQTASVRIDVFSDFECPYCRQEFLILNRTFFPEHRADIRITFHQNPLLNHPWARRAAELTECAYEQRGDLFWAAHDFLFDNQNLIESSNIDGKVLDALSKAQGFRPENFQSCLANHSADSWPEIDADRKLAMELDVRSTPTLFINGLKMEGTPPLEQLDTLVRELRKTAALSPETPLAGIAGSKK